MTTTRVRGRDRGRAPGRGTPGSFDIKHQSSAEVSLDAEAGSALPEKKLTKADEHKALVARELLSAMREGTAPWQRPWAPGELSAYRPSNAATGRPYSGQNTLWLMISATRAGYPSNQWMTFNQAKKLGGQVRKGEHGTRILIYKTFERRDKDGSPMLDDHGKPMTGVFASTATVFNIAQVDGLPEKATPADAAPTERAWEDDRVGQSVIDSSGAVIHHVSQDRAFYRPSTDEITLPTREQFPDASSYYSTAFHELSHWTGHPSRLNRVHGKSFGDHDYAGEELVAELSSFLISSETQVGYEPAQTAAYLKSWSDARGSKDAEAEVQQALHDAGRAAKYLLDKIPGRSA
ncbi:ArdC family protein [Pseudoclavibacter soli]|uniref:ArdC family protein n=1 Tax=Pseudoclavibacter soli TaxID=452623 RepID=UPI00146E508F|nr:zincin-like metallopeptidase domain-containing protein [Pseudoclavibacter soli]